MLPPVFQVLKASTDVKAIVGQNPPRIYRHDSVPQDTTKPYIAWFLVSGAPENNLSEPSPTQRNTVQIDCWHQTDAGVDQLADAVRSALEPVVHITGVVVNDRDIETKLYRIGLQADFWGR
jgi:hypothetical protein